MRAKYWLMGWIVSIGAGCPGRDPPATEDSDGSSGGTTDATGSIPTTGEPGDDSVIAPVIALYHPLEGAPVEQAMDPLQAYADITIVAGADAQEFPGVYDGATRIEFAGVPEGTYVLRQQFPPHPTLPGEPGILFAIETSARELGIYTDAQSGRPDVALTDDVQTAVVISATGMQPLGIGDSFEIYSHGADALAYLGPSLDPDDGTNGPLEGATELAGWTQPWSPATGRSDWPLVDPGAGDDLWLAHVRGRPLVAAPEGGQLQDPWSFASVSTLLEVASLSAGAMQAGAANAMSGAFVAVAADTITFDLRAQQFFTPLMAYTGATFGTSCFVSVFLEPGIEVPIIGMTPTLADISVVSQFLPLDPLCPPDACDPDLCAECLEEYAFFGDRVFDLEYANPYPGGTEAVQASCRTTTFVTHPEEQTTERISAGFAVSGRLAEMTDKPIVPTIGLVGDLRVNGAPAGLDSVRMGVGTTPTITFTPPDFGDVEYYAVAVQRLDDVEDVDGELLERRSVGGINTMNTTVTLPEGLMQPGGYYVVFVTARTGSTLTGGGWTSFNVDGSTAVTGLLSP